MWALVWIFAARGLAAKGLAAKEPMLEISDLGLSLVEFVTKGSLALLGLDLRQSHLGAQTQRSLAVNPRENVNGVQRRWPGMSQATGSPKACGGVLRSWCAQ